MYQDTMRCFICGRSINVSHGDMRANSWGCAGGGVFLHGAGNYGSALFDPLDGPEYIRVVICDPCLRVRASRAQVIIEGVSVDNGPRREVKNLIDYIDADSTAALFGLACAFDEDPEDPDEHS